MAKDSARHNRNGSNRSDVRSDAQIERSNSTFNMFIGGRQPSWLNGEVVLTTRPPNPNPTPNPCADNQTRPQNGRNVHAPDALPETDGGLSKSTSNSPFLANTMTPPQKPSITNALSPPLTPTAETPDLIPPPRDDTPVDMNENINGRKRIQQTTTALASPKRRRVEITGQSPNFQQQQTSSYIITDVHRVESGNGVKQFEQGDNISHAPMQPPASAAAPSSSRQTSGSPAVRQGTWTSPQIQMQPQNLGQHVQSGPPPAPAPNHVMRSNVHPVLVAKGLQQFLFVDPFALHAPYEKDGCRGILKAYIKSRGGLGNLGSTERLRLQVLETAVEHNDWIFLFLHHIISQQFLNPGFVPPAIFSTPNFAEAAYILNLILGSPQLQDRGMLTFFAAFPCQLGLSLSFNPTKDDGFAFLNQFIPHLPQVWRNLETECRQRQYPPTIPEMAAYLKLISPTFMRIFFTAARRLAWPCTPEQEQGSQMTQIFQEADAIFTRARETFFYEFHRYQPNDEIRSYLRLQRNYLHLCHRQNQNHNQQNQVQQQVQPQQIRTQQSQIEQGLAQGQIRGQGNVRTIHLKPSPAPKPNLQVSTGGPSIQPSHHSPQSGTVPSPRNPPVGVFGVPDVLGSPRLAANQSLAAPTIHGQPPVGNTGVPRGRAQQVGGPVNAQRAAQPCPLSIRFMPGVNDPPPPQPAQPNPQMSALHQAHLREPILTRSSHTSEESLTSVFYQMVAYYLLPPKQLEADSLVQDWTFNLSDEEFRHIASTLPSDFGQRSTRILAEDSHQYRLRCSKIGSGQTIKANDWTVSDTSFPTYMYLTINGKDLEIRRKLHYGKDLPVDLTEHLVVGQNTLQILLNTNPGDSDASDYALAVETVGIKSEESIVQACSKRMRAADDVLVSIKNSLNSGSAGAADDDDLIMVSGNVTIEMVDPITQSNSFTLPVRGDNCTHWNCFDLAAFLQTRAPAETRTREKSHYISAVDVWRCPICRGDARPQSLIADAFVLEARNKLVKDGKGKARAIIVEADGTWRPKPEMVREGGLPSQSRQTPLSAAPQFHQGSFGQQHAATLNLINSMAQSAAINGQSATPLVPKKLVEIVDLGSDSD